MSDSVELVPDVDKKVAQIPELLTNSMDVATKLASVARGSAPVSTGAYRDGIIAQHTKSGARVFASDEKSAWIEFGIPSRGIPAQFILRRAADALGLKFKGHS